MAKQKKRKKEREISRNFYYKRVDGVKKKVFRRKLFNNPSKARKESLYNRFQSNVSSYLKDNKLDWRDYGVTYQSAISKLWGQAKFTYTDSFSLTYAIENIGEFMQPLSDSTRRKDLDSLEQMDDIRWWEIRDNLGTIGFKKGDTFDLGIPEEYLYLLKGSEDLTSSKNQELFWLSLKELLRANKEELSTNPLYSNYFKLSLEYDLDEENNIHVKAEMEGLVELLKSKYGSGLPVVASKNIDVKDVPEQDIVLKDGNKSDSELNIMRYDTEVRLLQDEYKLGIHDKKEYREEKELLRKKYNM